MISQVKEMALNGASRGGEAIQTWFVLDLLKGNWQESPHAFHQGSPVRSSL